MGETPLADLIRKGSLIRPQIFGTYVSLNGTCVVGAATDGLWGEGWSGHKAIMALPNISLSLRRPCDCRSDYAQYQLWQIMIHLNDDHRWTREQIADWVAIQEKEPR